jgi:hypothetical protein
MMDNLAKLSAEIFSNPLLSNSVSGIIGLLGAVVGGTITAWATAAGVRRSLEAQFQLQRDEWERRDRDRDQERQDRETREKNEQEQQGTAAVQALAIEALWNSISLLTAAKQVETSANPAPRIRLLREQFDKHFLRAARRLDGIYMQQTVNTYLSGLSLQQSRDARNALPIGKDELKKMNNLSTSFAIIFRALGQRVFSRQELQEFEMTRNIALEEQSQ